jgi:nucleotide-binding universal stress UspA family protein
MDSQNPNTVIYKNIVCPVDFSDCSTKAFYRAVGYCQLFNAKLTVLSVREGGPVNTYEDVSNGREALDALREGLVTRLDLLQEEGRITRDERQRITLETRNGKPYEEILRFALQSECDLIVMGTHGNTGFKHLFMGSQAERVVRRAPCDVLTVKPDGYDPKLDLG